MAANATLPGANAALADSRGITTPQFYRFFMAMAQAQLGNASAAEIAAINAELAALQAQIDALPQNEGFPVLQVLSPLFSNGLLQNGFAQIGIDLTKLDAESNIPEGWVFG